MKTSIRLAAAIACALAFAHAQEPWENPIKKLLREGKPVIGLTVTVPSVDVVAQAASIGFDYVWIEMEHSPITLETARAMVHATRGTPTIPIIRVPVNELWTAKRALDVGALGVIFPFTSTPELAKQAVDACKYPPFGKRGSGPALASLRWPAPQGYADFADKNALVIIIIEEKRAVEKIDEILSVPGIDVAFIGPNDLSHSYGHRGKMMPDVEAAMEKVVASCKKHNVAAGRMVPLGEIQQYVKQGYTFFQAPSDLVFMAAGARSMLEAAGKKPPDLKSRPMY